MSVRTTTSRILYEAVRVNRAPFAPWIPLRSAIGVSLPLTLGVLLGHMDIGLAVSMGAFQICFSDRPEPYRQRAGWLLLCSVTGALSVFAGAASAGIAPLAVLVAAVWGLAAGLGVIRGAAAMQVGVTSLLLLTLYSGVAMPPEQALWLAALTLVGGLFQTLLAVAAWPFRRYVPEREALAAVFRALVAYSSTPTASDRPPAVTAEITAARTALDGLGDRSGAVPEALSILLDQAERIRVELFALDRARARLHREGGDATMLDRIDALWLASYALLDWIGGLLLTGQLPVAGGALLEQVAIANRSLQQTPETDQAEYWRQARVKAHADALTGELRAAVELARRGEEIAPPASKPRSLALRLREGRTILSANLTLRSAAFRHAVRLSGSMAAATVLAHVLPFPRLYWVPLTVAIVLRPDFNGTFSRGFARIAGTLLGLVLAAGLSFGVFGTVPGEIVLLALLTFLTRVLLPANYGLAVIPITALVVILTSLTGPNAAETIIERGFSTLLGGALALGAYFVWPTWERTQTPAALANMLDRYREYFSAVMALYLDPSAPDEQLITARLAARLGRSNAVASLERLENEPGRIPPAVATASGVLANSHRFIHSVLEMESWLYQRPAQPAPPAPAGLRHFISDTEKMLHLLAETLRQPDQPIHDLPDLRADLNALGTSQAPPASDADYRLRALTAEAERITNSLNTIAYLLERKHGVPQES